jgi:cell division inhibitor SepF
MSIWSKFLNLIGFEDEEDDDTEEMVEETEQPIDVPVRYRSNVVELQSAKNVKLVVLGPKSYEDVQAIVDHLRARRPVVVNLEGAEPRVRVRILDFLSGAAYALGGRNQRVSDLIFLVAPANVDINNLLEEDVISHLDNPSKMGGL